MMNDGLFYDADLPWVPTLVDVEKGKTGDEAAYWSKFGWENLVVPEDCPITLGRMSILKVRFDERYANRMLNQETMERWQIRLQNRFDEVVHRYERAYRLYNQHSTKIDDGVLPGTLRELDGTYENTSDRSETSDSSGSNTSTSTGRNRTGESPDQKVNALSNYATVVADSSTETTTTNTGGSKGSSTANTSGNTHTTDRSTVTGAVLMENLNGAIDGYRDIDTEFVKAFENNFMNIFWY